jgi:peptidoglycan hydrolase CwlO-like protein
MENKKVKVALLGLALVTFLASGCVDSKKIKQLENEAAQLNQVILQKDAKIKMLTDQAQIKQEELESIKKDFDSTKKELDSAKKELDSTKKELDNVNNKLNTLMAAPGTVKN